MIGFETRGLERGEMLKEGMGVLISEDVCLRDVPAELSVDDV